jgi:hypothetical protein
MTFPTGLQITTANLDSPERDPGLARADLLSLTQAFNQVTASANAASGVVVLNASGKLAVSQIPTTLNTTGDFTINPSTKIVNIRDVLRLTQRFVADNVVLTSPVGGDIIFLVDGDAGRPCLSVYDGANWRVVRLATTVGAVGAALTSTSTIVATADV